MGRETECEGEEEEGWGGTAPSAQTEAPGSIFDRRIIETVFTETCVCLSMRTHHSSFSHDMLSLMCGI